MHLSYINWIKIYHQTNIGQEFFEKSLVQQLVGNFRNNTKRRCTRNLDSVVRLNGKFHAIYIRKRNPYCKVCSGRTQPHGQKTTVYYCKTCPGNLALYPGECFEKFHTQTDFK